jgi:hypothetical protein
MNNRKGAMTPRANPTETEKRLARLEEENKQNRAAISQLAWLETRLAAIRPGTCPQLDAIRVEQAGSVDPLLETRPLAAALEQRTKVGV